MANQRPQSIETPGASFAPDLSTQLPSLPSDQGESGKAQALAGAQMGDEFGKVGDELAKSEGRQAGTLAGGDAGYRPLDVPTLRGQAFDQAAQDTYINNLQVQTRGQINQAVQDYSLLPQDQKTPDKLQSSLQKIYNDTQQNDVFPAIKSRFADTFDKLSFPYLRKAQDDHDNYIGDQAKASLLVNQQSISGNAIRAASLGTADGMHLAQTESDGFDRLTDAAINEGTISPEAGAKMKMAHKQGVLQASALAQFLQQPDPKKGDYYEQFSKAYGEGRTGLINPQFGDPDAPIAQRNNNFTNMKPGGQFAVYPTPEAGLAAADKNLQSYAHRGLDTVAKIVSTWSPPSENDTPTLIANMSRRVGVNPQQKLDMNDPQVRARIIGGLITQETGKAPFSVDDIAGAITGNPTAGMTPQSYQYVQHQMEGELRALTSAATGQSRDALADIAAAKKQTTEGFDLTPDAWQTLQSKYVSSPDPTVQQALGQLGAIRSQFAGFRGKTPQQIETSVAASTPTREQGTEAAQVPILQATQGYLTKYRSDIAADPLRRAQHEGFITNLQPIDFTKPETVAGGIAARAPQADATATAFGSQPVLLLPDEKAQLKKIANAGGAPMIQAAQAVVQALGSRAGQVFEEAAGDAPKFATAGRVAAWGGSSAFLDDFARRQELARDPAANKALELPAKTATDPVANDVIGGSLAQIPSMNAAVRQAARDVFEVRALANNYDKQLTATGAQDAFKRGLQEAAGATFAPDGTQYGGIGTMGAHWYGGGQKVLAPLHMRADAVDTAIGALTDADLGKLPAPPMAGDGKTPISARMLQGAQLTSLGHGIYQASLGDPQGRDPQWLRTATGQKFTLDLNALEPTLRQRVPQIYRTP